MTRVISLKEHKPLKVGYVLKRFPRFSETFILNEILELERQGVKVHIFSLMQPPPQARHQLLSKLRAPVIYLPRSNGLKRWKVVSGLSDEDQFENDIESCFANDKLPFAEFFPDRNAQQASHLCFQATTLAMFAASHGIQHLHAHFASNATTVALLASRLSEIPFSFTAHARDIYHTYTDQCVDDDLRRRKIAEARFVVTVSDYNRDHLQTLADLWARNRIYRLYNGVNLSRFNSKITNRQIDLFVAVGRLVEKKGFQYLINACEILQQRNRQFRCEIVGDGPQQDVLAQQICDAGLTEKVKLAGAKPQELLIDYMKHAAAVVLPCVVSSSGDRDGLPTVLLEGMAMGLPVISTRVAGVPEIVDHEETGLLVSPENSLELANAMERVLDDPARCKVMGEAARQKSEHLFDLRKNVATLAGYFAHSVDGGKFDSLEMHDADRLRYSG